MDETNVRDLLDAINADHGDAFVDFILLGMDNATDYSVASPILIHHLYRLFRERCCAMLIANPHAPTKSARHVEIERIWTDPRRAIAGQHFGYSAYDHGVEALEGVAREEKLTEIASAAVQEYAHLVRENCKVGGEPWRVVVRGAADPDELPGQELVRRVYGVKVENGRRP